jgi:hypothetical protein
MIYARLCNAIQEGGEDGNSELFKSPTTFDEEDGNSELFKSPTTTFDEVVQQVFRHRLHFSAPMRW